MIADTQGDTEDLAFASEPNFDNAAPDSMSDAEPEPEFFMHPQRGKVQTTLFENSRHTRLYFDDELGEWHRMPLSWERTMPSVLEMLQRIDSALPLWQNVNEQVQSFNHLVPVIVRTLSKVHTSYYRYARFV
jgi:hypothetical protein